MISRTVRNWLLVALLIVGIGVYFFRSFHPEQPMHHQLNEAGGVIVVSALVVWLFGKSEDD